MELPPEIIVRVISTIEELHEADRRIDELEADMRKVYKRAPIGEITIEVMQRRIATVERAIADTQQVLNIIDDKADDAVSITLRELFVNRFKLMTETRQYWQTALTSLLS